MDVALDHKACNLGKWLYGEEKKEAELQVPSLAPMLETAVCIEENLPAFAEIEKAAEVRSTVREEWSQINSQIFDAIAEIRSSTMDIRRFEI